MSWTISFLNRARKTLAQIDPKAQRRIQVLLDELGELDSPRSRGKALQGQHGLWIYRISDYRIIARIQDQQLTVLIVKIGHRREVYKNMDAPEPE